MNTNHCSPRCSVGQQLWEDIDRAKATGNRDAIYRALVAYFTHKNGKYGSRGTKKFRAECRDCLDRRREAQGAQP